MHHAVAIGGGGNQAAFGIADFKVAVGAGGVGEGLQFVLQLEEIGLQPGVEAEHGGPIALAALGVEGSGVEGGEAGEARPEIPERLHGHGEGSGGLALLLAQPAAVLLGDGGDQAAGMLVALDLDQFELMEQADLKLDHHNMGFERLKDGEFGAGVAGMHQLFEQVIEIGDQAIAKAEFMLAGQAMQQGNKPVDQIEAGFDDRQLSAGDGGAVIGVAGIGGGRHRVVLLKQI
jgi:hypothetical protein